MQYEVIVSTVHSRSDLLERTLRSMVMMLDVKPSRIIIHEDGKASEHYYKGQTEAVVEKLQVDFGIPITFFTKFPGTGLGQAMVKLLDESTTDFVFYTQEDFDFLRIVPVDRCLALMAAHDLNHVRFNKRKTMRVKGADRPVHEQFHKVEVEFDVPSHTREVDKQTLCISDHWYFQANLGRRSVFREGFQALNHVAGGNAFDRCEVKFNQWYNQTYGKDIHLRDPKLRRERVKTFIWGGIGEPAFIQHTGHDRRSQDWPEPKKRDPNS